MVKFIEGPKGIRMHDYDWENKTVNLSLVTHISVGRLKWGYDTIGKPSLRFYFTKTEYTEWLFNSAEERDTLHKSIVEGTVE